MSFPVAAKAEAAAVLLAVGKEKTPAYELVSRRRRSIWERVVATARRNLEMLQPHMNVEGKTRGVEMFLKVDHGICHEPSA